MPTRRQIFPSRPLRLIVPFAPGGSVDTAARLFADPLAANLGQSVVVENRAGAGGTIGADAVAKAPADGNTLLWGSSAMVSIAAALRRHLPYNPLTDLAPLSVVMRAWHALLGSPKLPGTDLAAAFATARAQPGALNIASGGTGSATHLLAERLKLVAGLDLVHVPYRGSGQIYPDLASGRVHFAFESLPVALAQAQAGSARLLAVTAPQRAASRAAWKSGGATPGSVGSEMGASSAGSAGLRKPGGGKRGWQHPGRHAAAADKKRASAEALARPDQPFCWIADRRQPSPGKRV